MGHKACNLGLERERRRGYGTHCGYPVEEVGEPVEPGIVAQIEAPHGVVDNLVANIYLFREGFLGIVEHGGAKGEGWVEAITEVETQEGLALG